MIDALNEAYGRSEIADSMLDEMKAFHEDYVHGHLSKEEYEFLLSEIKDVRAALDLASDEETCRLVVAAAEAILAVA